MPLAHLAHNVALLFYEDDPVLRGPQCSIAVPNTLRILDVSRCIACTFRNLTKKIRNIINTKKSRNIVKIRL